MKIRAYLFLCALPLAMFSCKSEPEQTTTKIDKKGSVEVLMNSANINSEQEVVTITYKVWKDGNIISEKIIKDTVAALPPAMAEVEKSEGQFIKQMMPKNYDFYVTIQ